MCVLHTLTVTVVWDYLRKQLITKSVYRKWRHSGNANKGRSSYCETRWRGCRMTWGGSTGNWGRKRGHWSVLLDSTCEQNKHGNATLGWCEQLLQKDWKMPFWSYYWESTSRQQADKPAQFWDHIIHVHMPLSNTYHHPLTLTLVHTHTHTHTVWLLHLMRRQSKNHIQLLVKTCTLTSAQTASPQTSLTCALVSGCWLNICSVEVWHHGHTSWCTCINN